MGKARVGIYAMYDDDGEYVDDYTLKELSEMTGISTAACYQRVTAGAKINGYRCEKVDEAVGKKNPMWDEYERTRMKILRLLRRRTK